MTTGGLPTPAEVDDAPEPRSSPRPRARRPAPIAAEPRPGSRPGRPGAGAPRPSPSPARRSPRARPGRPRARPGRRRAADSHASPGRAGRAGPAGRQPLGRQAGRRHSIRTTPQAVAQELTSQGISDAWAQQLIVAAAAHRSPLAKGSLRDAVRATLAATIPAPAPLPATGAAIAFVGAGGAGKTRCAAALASAYAKGSTLAASVVSLGSDDWGGDLKELLKGQNVWVMGAAVGPEAAPAVQHGRDGGLVVIDTAGVTPRDPAGVEALAGELRSLSLDAVYIAVPATFSVHAARKLIEGFAALGADGIAVTHADEADQLGIAAELAHISGMPVAYIHEGLELDGALSAADPSSLAARLLP